MINIKLGREVFGKEDQHNIEGPENQFLSSLAQLLVKYCV